MITCNKLASRLDTLQAKENDGRGVSCVRAIIAEIRLGNVDSAKTICITESDKLRNYPRIARLLEFTFRIKINA